MKPALKIRFTRPQWIFDVEALNAITDAARKAVLQPDTERLEALDRAIKAAEGNDDVS